MNAQIVPTCVALRVKEMAFIGLDRDCSLVQCMYFRDLDKITKKALETLRISGKCERAREGDPSEAIRRGSVNRAFQSNL